MNLKNLLNNTWDIGKVITKYATICSIVMLSSTKLESYLLELCNFKNDSDIAKQFKQDTRLAFERLNTEAQYLNVTDSAYVRLDRILNKAKEDIIIKIMADQPILPPDNVDIINRQIENILSEEGFVYEPTATLEKGLDEKHLDCDTKTTIYRSIYTSLFPNIQFNSVAAPRHIFMRFSDPYLKTHTNIECTRGQRLSDEYYIKNNKLDKYIMEKERYLCTLSDDEVKSVWYHGISSETAGNLPKTSARTAMLATKLTPAQRFQKNINFVKFLNYIY